MKKLVFVIYKHQGTPLHYDFQLKIGTHMSLWSITKGPTLDPKLKRLARKVDDHELKDGPITAWDEGTYESQVEIEKGKLQNIDNYKEAQKTFDEGLKIGQIKFELYGKKLKGSFALIKTPAFGKNSWLLIKHKDKYIKEGYDANDF